jgi:hypothetical protein
MKRMVSAFDVRGDAEQAETEPRRERTDNDERGSKKRRPRSRPHNTDGTSP